MVRDSDDIIIKTVARILAPFIQLYALYVIMHGHHSPGGGFQGGAIIASGFLLIYLGCRERRINRVASNLAESLGGLIFVVTGLFGLVFGGYFLLNFLPKGTANALFSAGIILTVATSFRNIGVP